MFLIPTHPSPFLFLSPCLLSVHILSGSMAPSFFPAVHLPDRTAISFLYCFFLSSLLFRKNSPTFISLGGMTFRPYLVASVRSPCPSCPFLSLLSTLARSSLGPVQPIKPALLRQTLLFHCLHFYLRSSLSLAHPSLLGHHGSSATLRGRR